MVYSESTPYEVWTFPSTSGVTTEWSPSAYTPVKDPRCNKVLGNLGVRLNDAWFEEEPRGVDFSRRYTTRVWSAAGIKSSCCKESMKNFSAKDSLQMAYDEEDKKQPADFSFDEHIRIRSTKRGHRDVPFTRYETTTAQYYNQ